MLEDDLAEVLVALHPVQRINGDLHQHLALARRHLRRIAGPVSVRM
jgi:uncharacterized protein with von Willebrand factor type A (vWA) domain